jgi:hypothetical protein
MIPLQASPPHELSHTVRAHTLLAIALVGAACILSEAPSPLNLDWPSTETITVVANHVRLAARHVVGLIEFASFFAHVVADADGHISSRTTWFMAGCTVASVTIVAISGLSLV